MSSPSTTRQAAAAAHRALALLGVLLLLVAMVGPASHDHSSVVEPADGSWSCSADHHELEHSAEAPEAASAASDEAPESWHSAAPRHQHVCIGCQGKSRRGQQVGGGDDSLALDLASRRLLSPQTQARRSFRHATPPLRGPPLV